MPSDRSIVEDIVVDCTASTLHDCNIFSEVLIETSFIYRSAFIWTTEKAGQQKNILQSAKQLHKLLSILLRHAKADL